MVAFVAGFTPGRVLHRVATVNTPSRAELMMRVHAEE
jgi:hypothetical protein